MDQLGNGPVGEASADTSYEIVSSASSQTPAAFGTANSVETTPIARSESSTAYSPPIQFFVFAVCLPGVIIFTLVSGRHCFGGGGRWAQKVQTASANRK